MEINQNRIREFFFNNDLLNGFLLGFVVYMIDLFLLNVFWAKEGSFEFFLKSGWQLKTLVGYGSLAAIPIVGLFAYFLQKRRERLAQGLQLFLILVVLLLAYLKFFA